MPMVLATRLPSHSSCQVSRRVRATRSATIPMAVSRSSCSHSVAYGLRYSTPCSRPGPVVSWSVAEPLGQSLPRLIGESGSPSIWTTFSSRT